MKNNVRKLVRKLVKEEDEQPEFLEIYIQQIPGQEDSIIIKPKPGSSRKGLLLLSKAIFDDKRQIRKFGKYYGINNALLGYMEFNEDKKVI